MDIENAIATANSQNKFLHKTLIKEKEKHKEVDPNDPMNCIPEILENFSKSTHQNKRKHEKLDKKSYKKECALECCNLSVISSCSKCSRRNHPKPQTESEAYSSCDTSCDQCQQSCDHEMIIQTCAEKPADYVPKQEPEITKNKPKIEKKIPQKSTSFTVKSFKTSLIPENKLNCDINLNNDTEISVGSSCVSERQDSEKIRELDYVEAIPENVIRQYKLTAEEVKKLPRFETYAPGEPSNVS